MRICSLLLSLLAASLFVYSRPTALADIPSVYDLSCEYRTNPMGMDVTRPRLSWKIRSNQKSSVQTAYEIRVSEHPDRWDDTYPLWHSGKIEMDRSLWVPYSGKALQSATRYFWQVRIWDNHGNVSSWSETAWWETGLLDTGDWRAKWIVNPADTLAAASPAPLFRKLFVADGNIRDARLYITSRGLYEAFINGHRVGEAYFTPGWTSYKKRLQYQIYDVTGLLAKGDNSIGVMLGDGWYRGDLFGSRNRYGQQLALLAQIRIAYTDGRVVYIATDGSWMTTKDGPIHMAELYHGEHYDARKEMEGWSVTGFDAEGWVNASMDDTTGYDHLVTSLAPPVTTHDRIRPVKIFTTPTGEKVIDFGQNLVGWVTFTASASKGDSLVISHAEVLDKEGNFYTENLRAANQRVTYVFKGEGTETYHPHFSFQGFRYIKLTGNAGLIHEGNIEAVAVHTAMEPVGTFETSNPLINQLQHNIVWGQKGNFLDVPTDCPQRDERLGWTGDAQVFFATAAFNMDVSGFFSKWLQDLAVDQFDSGAIPHFIPYFRPDERGGSAGWSDASTIVPWNFFVAYGDTAILRRQYGSMQKWIGYMEATSTNHLWNTGFHFGDWLFFAPDDDRSGLAAITDKYLIAQAYYAYSLQIMIQTAAVLNQTQDVAKYRELQKQVKAAFMKEYVTPSGRLVSGTQTAYVLALHFDLLPEHLREPAAQRLVDNIASYGNHLTTGFLGTPYLCHVLSRFGHADIAYRLLMQETYPSWLYPVKQGATTIWERWDGIKPDGTFQNVRMNSFNHYAYGAIGDWMYKQITGIQPVAEHPGYREFVISPNVGGGLTFAKASFNSPYGLIRSEWSLDGEKMSLEVEVPVNTQARVYFQDAIQGTIKNGAGAIIKADHIALGSGVHHFQYRLNKD